MSDQRELTTDQREKLDELITKLQSMEPDEQREAALVAGAFSLGVKYGEQKSA